MIDQRSLPLSAGSTTTKKSRQRGTQEKVGVVLLETVIVTEEKGAERLKALTGKQLGPVLQVGEKQVLEGFNADRWQAALDDAGYPRNVPNLRREPPRTAAAAKPKVEEIPPPPKPGTGYPVY